MDDCQDLREDGEVEGEQLGGVGIFRGEWDAQTGEEQGGELDREPQEQRGGARRKVSRGRG